ncbi:MAG: hypothetical protein IKE58_01650 [Blautia sp.]|nr:hypothetical protein [Blautia sp.]
MSQKKVDAYKQQKANREKIMKKEKMILRLEKGLAMLVCLGIVCWVGFSIYGKATENRVQEVVDTQISTAALDEYINGLSVEQGGTATTEEAADEEAVVEDAAVEEEAAAEDAVAEGEASAEEAAGGEEASAEEASAEEAVGGEEASAEETAAEESAEEETAAAEKAAE